MDESRNIEQLIGAAILGLSGATPSSSGPGEGAREQVARARVLGVNIERCDECGFDGSAWTDGDAMEAIGSLPVEWSEAVGGVGPDDLACRPIPEMWSIAEYVDHVREVLFGMRFVLDSALAEPGVHLGAPPEPRFDPTPRAIDVVAALRGIEHEAASLRERLAALGGEEWTVTATVGEEELDARWIARHAVHDAHHHLLDVQRLREALRRPTHG